jgi:Tfp pilus assembly protein PilN
MVNINFVPDDYVQNVESRRTNLMYLVLLLVVMAAIGGTFTTFKIRQRALAAKERIVNTKLVRAREAIEKLEQLQAKRKEMMKTALTTAELGESVPRSVLLAALTNNLPSGVSLMKLKLVQKKPKITTGTPTSKYQKTQADKTADPAPSEISPEKLLQTNIDIEGIAPSDRQVAAYIELLNSSTLLENVALVLSKEHKIEENTFRQFKLTAMLEKNVELSKEDIDIIKTGGQENAPRIF